jgi:hypothetical protein
VKMIILKTTPIAVVAILFTCFMACSSSSGGGGDGGGGNGGAGGGSAGGGAGGGNGAGGGGSSSFSCGSATCDPSSQYCGLSATADSNGNAVWSPSACVTVPSSCATAGDPCTCLYNLDCPESGTVVNQCTISNGQLSFGCQNL